MDWLLLAARLRSHSSTRRFRHRTAPAILAGSGVDAPKRFRFLNAERFGTILAVQPFNRFPLATARNRLQVAI
jgi:hypothetical protein